MSLVWKLVLELNLVSVVQLTEIYWQWFLVRTHNNLPRLVWHDPVPILNLLLWQKLMYTHSPVRKRRKLYWVHRDWIVITSLKYNPVHVTWTNDIYWMRFLRYSAKSRSRSWLFSFYLCNTEHTSITFSNNLDLKILERRRQWKHCLKSEWQVLSFSSWLFQLTYYCRQTFLELNFKEPHPS